MTQNPTGGRRSGTISLMKKTKKLKDFAQNYGHKELSFTLSKVSSILHEIKLRAPKYHKTITADSFLLEIHIVSLKVFLQYQGKLDDSIQCTSLKVHHGHSMGILSYLLGFCLKLLSINVSDFPHQKACSLASRRLLLRLPKVHHGHFMSLFYPGYCVAVTRYCP